MNRPTLRPVTRRDVLELTLRSVASLAFVPAVGACGAEDSPPPSTRRIEFNPATVTAVDALAEQCLQAFDAPGAALALLQGGEVIYAKGFGVRNLATGQPFTPDTVHRIASTSKSMSAMLVARHVDATDTHATVLLAGQVNGTVTTLLDTRQVAVAGLLAGLGIGMALAASRLFRRG